MRKALALGTATALSIVASSMAPIPAWAVDAVTGDANSALFSAE